MSDEVRHVLRNLMQLAAFFWINRHSGDFMRYANLQVYQYSTYPHAQSFCVCVILLSSISQDLIPNVITIFVDTPILYSILSAYNLPLISLVCRAGLRWIIGHMGGLINPRPGANIAGPVILTPIGLPCLKRGNLIKMDLLLTTFKRHFNRNL